MIPDPHDHDAAIHVITITEMRNVPAPLIREEDAEVVNDMLAQDASDRFFVQEILENLEQQAAPLTARLVRRLSLQAHDVAQGILDLRDEHRGRDDDVSIKIGGQAALKNSRFPRVEDGRFQQMITQVSGRRPEAPAHAHDHRA
jgi:hypothetical protein